MVNETPVAGDVTGLLRCWGDGDANALAEVASATYGDLHAVASGVLRRHNSGDTVQATGLVNELYIRLTRQRSVRFPSRRHFYAFAAFLMRRILVDHVRQSAVRRHDMRVPLHEEMAWVNAVGEEIIALDNALAELALLDERKARVIELRFFLGCTCDETAETLSISRATVERELQFAKAWLFARLHPET